MNETLQTIHALRTIHGDFSEREIADTDLTAILEASVCAANASGRQSYAVVVLDDRAQMKELFSYQGSRALIYCVDYTRIAALAKHLGHGFDSDHIIGFVTGTMDTMLAAQTTVIAAKSLGIDSMVTNGLHRNSLDKVYEALKLPATSCFPLATVVLGYPRQEPPYPKGRLDLDAVVHRGEYRAHTEAELDKIVAQYDDPARHIGMVPNWREQGFRHYLDWFYTKWTGKPVPRGVATGKILEFQERLSKSGFWWPME